MSAVPMRVYMSTFQKKFRIYAKHLTPRRMVNYLRVYSSMKLKQPKVWGRPLSLFIEPTNVCNLRCPLCPTGNNSTTKAKGMMALEDYKRIIDELGPTAFSVTLWNYGEPFINPQMIEMIKYAKTKGLKVITSTNGFAFRKEENIQAILDSGLDELILALDGATKETYAKYRINGDFELNIEGIKKLCKEKKRLHKYFPYTSVQFIIMKHNEHEVEAIQKLARELCVDELILKTVYLFNNPVLSKKFLPTDKKYSRYLTEEGVVCKTSVRPGCDGLWLGLNINYDGTVVPCCFDTHEKFKFGNVLKVKNFDEEIWNSKGYIGFRRRVWENKGAVEMCRNCPTNVESQDYARVTFAEL